MNTQTVSPYTKAATEYVDKFGLTLQNDIIALRDLKLKEASTSTLIPPPTYAYFSWTCYNHDVSASADFYTMAVDEGVTQKVNTCISIYIYSCIYMFIYMSICSHVYIHTYESVYICVYIYLLSISIYRMLLRRF